LSEAIRRKLELKERIRRERDQSYEERRQWALEHGTRVSFLICPLCGRGRPLDGHRGRAVFQVRPEYPLIQVRIGGGRGIGFFLLEEESLSLEEVREQYPEVYENLLESVEQLAEVLGLFEEEEEE